MKPDQTVTREYFIKRVADLCLRSGMSGLPKDDLDRHILYKSAVLAFDPDTVLTEKEVTARLETWVHTISQIKNIDGVTLRRYLIDTGYLTRSKDGTQYRVARPGPQPPFYEAGVDAVDVGEVIASARAEIERRKQAYLSKPGK